MAVCTKRSLLIFTDEKARSAGYLFPAGRVIRKFYSIWGLTINKAQCLKYTQSDSQLGSLWKWFLEINVKMHAYEYILAKYLFCIIRNFQKYVILK